MIKPPQKKQVFTELYADLQKQIDVDDSRGRSVPINMNFIEEGYLTKDTGFTLMGASEAELCHSLYHYKKKSGVSHIIRALGTKLQEYNPLDRTWSDILGSPTFTEGAEFAFVVYDDDLHGGNGVEKFFKWTGTAFTEYTAAPKGNIFEIFEDQLFISGVSTEPLTIYYSAVGDITDWSDATKVIKPLGTDAVTGLVNYYGQLLMFKKESIWKLTFQYDQVVNLFIPKIELQSNNYGACSRKAISWVENDVWFFTGREVRAIGFKDQQTGVLGVNASVLSENIKETLKLVDVSKYAQCVTAYNNRRFYLCIPLTASTNDTTFVCHTLYKNSWTKYVDRDKARINSFMFIDGDAYTTSSSPPYGVIDWQVDEADTEDLNNSLATES
jgi:hypothetical protein